MNSNLSVPKEEYGKFVIIEPDGQKAESSPQSIPRITETSEEIKKTDESPRVEFPEFGIKLNLAEKNELFANWAEVIRQTQKYEKSDLALNVDEINQKQHEDGSKPEIVQNKNEEQFVIEEKQPVEGQPEVTDFHPNAEGDSEAEEEEEEQLSNFGFPQDGRELPVHDFIQETDPHENFERQETIHNQEGAEDLVSHQSFGREKPIQHITVSNQDQDIIDFKKAFDLKYSSFKNSVIVKYKNIRFDYLKQMDFAVRENERDNNSAIDFLEQQIEISKSEREDAAFRATQSRIILGNILREKYNTFYIKRACFQAWKYYHEWKHYEEAKTKFWDNYYKKRDLFKFYLIIGERYLMMNL